MTVSTELSHEEYTGNGVTTDFDFRFRIFEAKHLIVSVVGTDGTERILTNGTDYTLRGVGAYRGGKVILKMPLAQSWKIGIARDLPAVQETDLRNQGKFFAEVHEDAFDYLTMLIQKSLGYLSLCLRKPSFISDHYDAKGHKISNLGKPVKDGDAVDLGTMKEHIGAKDKRSLRVADKDIPALPNAANRANKLLSFDNDGNPVVVVPESGSAADVLVELGKFGGDKLIGSSHGGTVYSDYALGEVIRSANFGDAQSVNSSRDAVFFTDEALWYVSKSTTYPVQVPEHPDAAWRCIGLLNGYPVYDVRNWGLVGDDFTDNTEAFKVMIAKTSGEYNKLTFPAGIFRYTNIGVITVSRTTWEGAGSLITSLRCVSTEPDHIALNIDAWPDPINPAQPYLDAFNLNRIHIEGNENTKYVLSVQGLSRSIWEDVTVWGASPAGTGIILKSTQLNRFSNIMCSMYRNISGKKINAPGTGMVMSSGTRAGSGVGGPSNNNFISLYIEGVARGLNIDSADNNQFIGGSCEANSDYGTNIREGCRYNTFIGMGNENLNATTADFIDKGTYTKFLNCYSSHRFVAQGKNSTIDGGYFERVEIQASAVSNEIKNITVSHWKTASGGLFDSGIGTIQYSVYTSGVDYINTTDVRHSIELTTRQVSGGTEGFWDNPTRLPVTIFIQGSATLTRVRILRGTDAASIGLASVQQLHLEARDRLELTWSTGSSVPVCSYRTKRGYN